MTGVELVQSIVEILVSGITGVATGIGEGLSTLAQSIFLTNTGDTQSISVFGILVVAFAGISLAEPLASINRSNSVKSEMIIPSQTLELRKV